MYEMEEPLIGTAEPGRPVTQPYWPYEPPARARHRCERPVSPSFPPPGVSPRWCPFPNGESISIAPASVAQEFSASYFMLFGIHIISTDHGWFSAGDGRYPRDNSQPVHTSPGVTREIPKISAVR